MRYGISTHLYHDQRLSRAHLEELRSHGFDAVEVFATRTHVDYHDARALDELAGWLGALNMRLHGIHAPITDSLGKGDRWGRTFSIASSEQSHRQEAVREAIAALDLARRTPAEVMVIHLGIPDAQHPSASDNSREAALRSIEDIHPAATALGVRLALEVIPNKLSTPESLVRMLEEDLSATDVGVCVDFGHANILGDVVDAIEHVSGHVIATHVHDNDGRTDAHLPPFDGRIDWAAALMAAQKIGYEGTLLFEVANTSTPRDVLTKTARAVQRFNGMMV